MVGDEPAEGAAQLGIVVAIVAAGFVAAIISTNGAGDSKPAVAHVEISAIGRGRPLGVPVAS